MPLTAVAPQLVATLVSSKVGPEFPSSCTCSSALSLLSRKESQLGRWHRNARGERSAHQGVASPKPRRRVHLIGIAIERMDPQTMGSTGPVADRCPPLHYEVPRPSYCK